MSVITAWVFLEPDARRFNIERVTETGRHALRIIVTCADQRVVETVRRFDNVGIRCDSRLRHERGGHAVAAGIARRHRTGHAAVINREAASIIGGDPNAILVLSTFNLSSLAHAAAAPMEPYQV